MQMQGLTDRRHEGFFVVESTGEAGEANHFSDKTIGKHSGPGHKMIAKQIIELSQLAKTILTLEFIKQNCTTFVCPGLKLNKKSSGLI